MTNTKQKPIIIDANLADDISNISLPNFLSEYFETDKTYETNFIDNNDFLSAIFGKTLNDFCPIIVSFSGTPHLQKTWSGTPWSGDLSFTLQNNNYFSLSTYKQYDLGMYKRKKSHFHALHAVMLDDIGSKISTDRLTLCPSWILETSPQNFQVGYLLNEPIKESALADKLMKAIINAGLCDAGADGPTTRLARLPVAVNGKHNPPFCCRLRLWLPDNCYSLHNLINGLQLDLIDNKSIKKQSIQMEKLEGIDSEQIWIPRTGINVVVAALMDSNLYKAALDDGKHDITCPWVNEHTEMVNNGTAYFEPNDNYPVGGFKCQHSHCSARHIRDLLNFLHIDINSARMKPTIRLIKGELHNIVNVAERELAATNQYYQKGGMIVSIDTDKTTKQTLIKPLSQSDLVRVFSNMATWEQFDGRSKNWVRIDPPARYVTVLHDSNNYRYLPLIKGIANQPYLHNGNLIKSAGYDLDTGMFGIFDSKRFVIFDKPTFEDANSALKVLKELLQEFCFAKDTDLSAALSALLTAAIRPSLANAPMFHICANTPGTGKSYLCELITAFASPQHGTPTTFSTSDEEFRKLLLSELLRVPAVMNFDNMTSDILPHKSLCAAITSEYITDRILGTSKTATVSTRTLFLSSGNNVTPIQDMTRRCVTINLYSKIEMPATRIFERPNLISEVLQEMKCTHLSRPIFLPDFVLHRSN